ncbi:hypothetical protein [Oscillatoria nigro-viridis]|nr:hypothetical protein [Oscillatoria nigro-viridis]
MEELEIGLRIESAKGLTFFGLEEINELLKNGANITAIEPVGTLTQQIQKEDGIVHLAITGFSLKVKFVKPST